MRPALVLFQRQRVGTALYEERQLGIVVRVTFLLFRRLLRHPMA